MPHMLRRSETRRNILFLWKHSARHYRRESRSRQSQKSAVGFVSQVPWSSQFRFEECSKESTLWTHSSITKSPESKRSLLFRNGKYGTVVVRLLEDEKYQMRMREQGCTQSDMEEFDNTAKEKWMFVASSDERAYHRGQYKGVQPYEGGDSDLIKTKKLPE